MNIQLGRSKFVRRAFGIDEIALVPGGRTVDPEITNTSWHIGGIKRDIPIVLNSISYEDNYQGDFETRRALIYTLDFSVKFYLYGPVTSSGVIKTVQVDQYADIPDNSPRREQRYKVTPKPTSADADDDFGFNETTSFFQDAKDFDPVSGTDKA